MQIAQKRRSLTTTLPAPTGGWNARDSLADMAPIDAVILQNWFPGTSEVVLRNGYTEYSTGISGQVETLINYAGANAQELFAISGASLYDVTGGGAVGSPVVTGLNSARFEYVNITTPGGSYVMMVSGADAPYAYDGTTWTNPAITGVTTSNLNNINMHQNRIWFTENNTLKAYYLGTGAIAGAVTAFDLSSIAQLGGYLVAMATWTIDAGYGVDDLAVFITSEGEIIVYKGTNPASSATWALVGIFRVGSPIGKRCWIKYAGDLLIITKDGVMPMSGALQSSRTNPRVALTDKIQSAISEATTVYGENFGWQLLYYPEANQLWVNVPVQEGTLQEQFVMNTITKAWCNYTNWYANCWQLYNDQPYFGGDGFVGKAWNTNSDAGNNINADCLQAFSDFGVKDLKRWTMAQPIIRTNGTPSLLLNINVDFDTSNLTAPISFSPTSYATWDVALWDNGVWGGDLNVIKNWQGINGVGKYAGTRLILASSGIEVTWVTTTFVMEPGAVL